MTQVLESKIKPPRRSTRVLVRSRIRDELLGARQHRLTVLQAGAGYGKSTALATLGGDQIPLIWYQITEEDRDPYVFLIHLCRATQYVFPELKSLPIQALEAWIGTHAPLPTREIIYQYMNAVGSLNVGPILFVFDDFHLVAHSHDIAHLMDWFVGSVPSDLHIIISTRSMLKLPNLSRWRSLGEVLLLEQSTLAFTEAEIKDLFEAHYHHPLTPVEIEKLFELSEGWAITLQLIWQSLSSGVIETVEDALQRTTESLESLFDVLTLEVFDRQEVEIQNFLKATAVLRVMYPSLCDDFLGISNSREVLHLLVDQDLFVVDLSEDGYRYHPIFKQFLLQQLSPSERIHWHSRAADCFHRRHNWDEAIYHYLQAQETTAAAELLQVYGQQLQTSGKLDTLANYLDQFAPEILSRFPSLLLYLGDLARLHSRFQEALGWYQQAEMVWRDQAKMDGVSRALRGQARVYLDTVNPSKAEKLLQDALRLTDGIQDRQAHARLYELLAENKLNAGKAEEAERLRQQAEHLRVEGPSDTQLLYRVLLRTGRIVEAKQVLEEKAAEETASPVPTPRSHRETLLLLSLIYAMQGEAQKALKTAQEGTQRGEALGSPFVTAVGYMRQGHAVCLETSNEPYTRAREKFEQAIEISRELSIPRLRVEAYWGLCRAAGYQGGLQESLSFAQEGIELAVKAGDEWIASLIRLTMGANYALAQQNTQAVAWLDDAVLGFKECSDTFGLTASRLWLSTVAYQQGEEARFIHHFEQVLALSQKNQYDFLFLQPTLLGLPDERMVIPLLVAARESGIGGQYPHRLLSQLGLGSLVYHPGYQLIVKTLGQFQLRLGNRSIPYDSWRRDAARQLFLLLITQRDAPLDRDQICEILWPGVEPKAAQRNFKVALNTVYNVLEPERKAGEESAFIVREGATYGLRPAADVFIDSQAFVEAIQAANQHGEQDSEEVRTWLERAITLYVGEYLPEYRYESWAASEREHLAVLFLQTADRYCSIAYEMGDYSKVIELSQRILQQDNCWERAYRFLMLAYDKLGDHGQVARTYQRCLETLSQEIDVHPSDETSQLYKQLTQ